ncbi:MAG: MFS transporter [Desulfobacteraceae bacterium]|jgi:OFA family oxalate/formate antiporter-like MFS transporter|nr:MFS transporter [Desulfobacteraceae bacterium]
MKSKIYYGWYIAAVAFWGYFLAVGTGFYAFNAFLEPLCNARGWTRTDLNLALVIGTVFGFSSQYIFGTILMKTGIRRLMLAGSLTAGISFIFIARVTSLWQFYLFYSLLFIGNGAYGGIVASSAVNNWFIEKRGQAIGFATAGMSLSGALLPLAALLLIQHIGIENAALCIGIVMILFGPLAWIMIKDWPEDMGMLPDGLPVNKDTYAAGQIQIHVPPSVISSVEWPLGRLVRTDVFWKLGLSFGMMMIGTVGVMSQLKPRFVDTGFPPMTAMLMMAATALIGAAGKYCWGMMCDRFDPKRIAIFMAVANALGLSLGLIKNSLAALIIFIPVFGFSMGGIMSTFPIIVATLFGRENFSSVLRYISFFLILQMFGYLIAGRSFDTTGSYDAAYGIFIGLDVIAAFLLFSLKK